jgi:hypothetical protein
VRAGKVPWHPCHAQSRKQTADEHNAVHVCERVVLMSRAIFAARRPRVGRPPTACDVRTSPIDLVRISHLRVAVTSACRCVRSLVRTAVPRRSSYYVCGLRKTALRLVVKSPSDSFRTPSQFHGPRQCHEDVHGFKSSELVFCVQSPKTPPITGRFDYFNCANFAHHSPILNHN